MNGLMLHAGGYSASLADITNVVTPPSTLTHYPIPHRVFLDHVLEALAYHGYTVTRQQHGLMGKAGRLALDGRLPVPRARLGPEDDQGRRRQADLRAGAG